MAAAGRDALAKIAAVLPDALRREIDAATLLVGPEAPHIDTVDAGLVREAIRREHKVALSYCDTSGRRTTRTIWPFALGFFDRVRVVVGWCEMRNGFRHFRLDRVTQLKKGNSRNLRCSRRAPYNVRTPKRAAYVLTVEAALRTVYESFPEIDSLPAFRQRESFPDIREPAFWAIYEKYKPYTLLGVARFYDCFVAVKHIARAAIPGDIVECGVFMGGAMAAMIEFAHHFGLRDRRFWLSDTFDGFPVGSADVDITGASVNFPKYASTLPVVEQVIALTGVPSDRVVYLKGPVEETLPSASIGKLALMRLDTDYKESTACELQHLYPKLSLGGVLIIDDYGHFEGVRQAVDEYFSGDAICLLSRVDYTGRSGVKFR